MKKRKMTTPDKLARLSNGLVRPDGDVQFTVETDAGRSLTVHCPVSELGEIFAYLGNLAKAAGELSGTPPPTHFQNDLAAVPAIGIAFAAGTNPSETLLVMRLHGFDMAFSVESNGLIALADDIRRIAMTLSAGGEKPQ
jgi:hypothetical protein